MESQCRCDGLEGSVDSSVLAPGSSHPGNTACPVARRGQQPVETGLWFFQPCTEHRLCVFLAGGHHGKV